MEYLSAWIILTRAALASLIFYGTVPGAHLHACHRVSIPRTGWRQEAAKKVASHACFMGIFALKLLCDKVALLMGWFRITEGR